MQKIVILTVKPSHTRFKLCLQLALYFKVPTVEQNQVCYTTHTQTLLQQQGLRMEFQALFQD